MQYYWKNIAFCLSALLIPAELAQIQVCGFSSKKKFEKNTNETYPINRQGRSELSIMGWKRFAVSYITLIRLGSEVGGVGHVCANLQQAIE